MRDSVAAIIVAAGRGERLGVGRRKQYAVLGGLPILSRTLMTFQYCAAVNSVVVVIPEDDDALVREQIIAPHRIPKVVAVVSGGATRRDSVARGLAAVSDEAAILLVHDGVRPLVSVPLIERVIDAARIHGAAVPVVSPKDAVKRGGKGWLSGTLDRSTLWLAQTPQGFRADLLRRAHAQPWAEAFDDSQLVEHLGQVVASVKGDWANLKITTPEDLLIGEALLSMRAP